MVHSVLQLKDMCWTCLRICIEKLKKFFSRCYMYLKQDIISSTIFDEMSTKRRFDENKLDEASSSTKLPVDEMTCRRSDSRRSVVNPLITVKTNARVNTRGSKMLPTNRTMRSYCRRRSHTLFGGWKKPSHWRGTLKFTNCETILKASDSYSVARLPEHCFTEYMYIVYQDSCNL